MLRFFDRFGKRLLHRGLSSLGVVHTNQDVTPESQAIDTWFEPDPLRLEELGRKLGALGRLLGSSPSMFELFHNAPSVVALRSCIRKQLTHDQSRAVEARRLGRRPPPLPWLCVISAGRPKSVIADYGMAPVRDCPGGFWQRSKADALTLISLGDLPRVRETLFLRLMSKGSTLLEACDEVDRLPRDAWERETAGALLVEVRAKMEQTRRELTEFDKEFLMRTEGVYEQWEQKVKSAGLKAGLRRGRKEGREEGREEGLGAGRLVEARSALRRVLARRKLALRPEDDAKIEGCSDLTTLERWLDESIEAKSAAQALR